MALLNELENKIPQKRCFAGTRLTNDVGVVAGICQVETKRQLAAPRLPHADVKIMFLHLCVQAAQASRRSLIDEPHGKSPLVYWWYPCMSPSKRLLGEPGG